MSISVQLSMMYKGVWHMLARAVQSHHQDSLVLKWLLTAKHLVAHARQVQSCMLKIHSQT